MILVTGGNEALQTELIDRLKAVLPSSGETAAEATVSLLDDVPAALREVTRSSEVVHLVVDLRTAEGVDRQAERDVLSALIDQAATKGAAVSILFDRLEVVGQGPRPLGDLRFVFGRTTVDQAVEIRTEDDLHETLEIIASHVRAHLTTRPAVLDLSVEEGRADHFRVGSLFAVDDGDYAHARTRSLISHRMGGFVADLREAYSALAQWPLRKELPWDPQGGQVSRAERSASAGTGWALDKSTTRTPNLQDVLNTFEEKESRGRLDGTLPDDTKWLTAWRRKPPLLLLTGESGTGKSLVAETIAAMLTPDGQETRFEKINSAGLTEKSWDHQVHGTGPKAWTGIDQAVIGQLARGAHGVVFFDEIGDLPLPVQAAMLTYLDERLVRPTRMTPFPGFQHIIAATNRDLDEGANQQWFRNDLLARFALRLEIPPLRERTVGDPHKNELWQLIDFVLQDPTANPLRSDGRHTVTHVSREAMMKLLDFDYLDGNFRELTEAVHNAARAAQRRYSRLIEVGDITLSYESRFRADRDSHRIRVLRVEVPEGAPRALVETEADLRLMAHRERRTFVTDKDENSWVLPAATAFTTDGVAYDEGSGPPPRR